VAQLAFVTLLARYAPNEFLAMAAPGRLLKVLLFEDMASMGTVLFH
jgi:hypothetical protein